MSDNNKIKEEVKKKYSQILKNSSSSSCCCSCNCDPNVGFTILSDDYSNKNGYVPDADLKLGCGLPVEYAKIKSGDIVVDLGCGAGIDAFITRNLVGEKGKVYGIDFTEEMIKKANKNLEKLKFNNMFFLYGDIENLPLEDNFADVVISNCVLNLVPDKKKAFSEIYRILKQGGHFSISDIVSTKEVPEFMRNIPELYTGCISGTLTLDEFKKIIKETGFSNFEVQSEKEIKIPKEVFEKYLGMNKYEVFKKSDVRFISINIYGEKK